MSSPDQNQSQNQPGLIAGHAQYVKGAAEEVIGNMTGSHDWTSSGTQDKQAAVGTMRAAGEQRDAESKGYGGVEERAGKIVGCEGMVKEGEESKK